MSERHAFPAQLPRLQSQAVLIGGPSQTLEVRTARYRSYHSDCCVLMDVAPDVRHT